MKRFFFLSSALLPALLLPFAALAAPPAASNPLLIYCAGLPGCTASGVIPFNEVFSGLLIQLLGTLPAYVRVLGVLGIMIGGAYILLSGGNEENVTKGKNTILWAVIGIFVTQVASQLVSFVELEANNRAVGTDLVTSIGLTLEGSILNLLYIALLGIAIYSGIRMVISLGKEEEFKKAQNGLFYAALGSIIINLSLQIFNAFFSL